jgi:hypothetical protein
MMNYFSWRRPFAGLAFSFVVSFVSIGALAASRHTRSPEIQLDTLIPRDKWAGAGLDKLSAAEQQTLAEDITGLLASPASTLNVTPPVKDRSQWRQLRRRMSQDDVKKLLGEPDRVSVSRFYDSWYYGGGSVTFDSKGHVDFWSEP